MTGFVNNVNICILLFIIVVNVCHTCICSKKYFIFFNRNFQTFFTISTFDFVFFLFLPLANFSLIWKRHHYKWRASNFDLSLTLMATEQWLFFSVPHLLWHGASVYNGHLRGPVTLTHTAERFALELSLPVFTTLFLSRLGFELNQRMYMQMKSCQRVYF